MQYTPFLFTELSLFFAILIQILKMQYKFRITPFVFTLFIMLLAASLSGQNLFENPETVTFAKREFNAGLRFTLAPEREELYTDESFFAVEQNIGSAAIELVSNNMVFLPARQEQWRLQFIAGPYMGKGSLADSSATEFIDADLSPSGVRGRLQGDYSSRFYWDSKNYTIVSVNAWGQYDIYRRHAEGTVTDSNGVAHDYENDSAQRKGRYGFQAKAGWGIGRLNPVNHIAAAQYLLEKYYPGRNFSDEEFRAVAREIGRIKHQRSIGAGRSADNETKQLNTFLNSKLFLEVPEGMENDWVVTEFRPRFEGSRVEFGPFFNYFNREPDFVYGGYLRYENQKYCSRKMNRNLSAGMKYNGYKKDDWITFEAAAGWNWYPTLQHELGFGIRYLPGMVVKSIDDLQPVRHAVVPYIEYFSQLSSKYRIETSFAYRIANEDEFVMPGPELSVSIYRSSY